MNRRGPLSIGRPPCYPRRCVHVHQELGPTFASPLPLLTFPHAACASRRCRTLSWRPRARIRPITMPPRRRTRSSGRPRSLRPRRSTHAPAPSASARRCLPSRLEEDSSRASSRRRSVATSCQRHRTGLRSRRAPAPRQQRNRLPRTPRHRRRGPRSPRKAGRPEPTPGARRVGEAGVPQRTGSSSSARRYAAVGMASEEP